MNLIVDIVLVLLILTSFVLLGSSRLGACIRIGALQGLVLGALPLALGGADLTLRVLLTGAGIMALKGFVFPYLLTRALRESDTSREVQPLVGYAASLFAGVLALLAAFWWDARLRFPPETGSRLVTPVAFFMMMTGLFLMVARRSAANQVIGFIVLENGIAAFGLALLRDIPLLIELGVLMDMFVAVFVMGIAIFRINREFDHMDSDRLTSLKG
jgi:hydrogenase-4 component E